MKAAQASVFLEQKNGHAGRAEVGEYMFLWKNNKIESPTHRKTCMYHPTDSKGASWKTHPVDRHSPTPKSQSPPCGVRKTTHVKLQHVTSPPQGIKQQAAKQQGNKDTEYKVTETESSTDKKSIRQTNKRRKCNSSGKSGTKLCAFPSRLFR